MRPSIYSVILGTYTWERDRKKNHIEWTWSKVTPQMEWPTLSRNMSTHSKNHCPSFSCSHIRVVWGQSCPPPAIFPQILLLVKLKANSFAYKITLVLNNWNKFVYLWFLLRYFNLFLVNKSIIMTVSLILNCDSSCCGQNFINIVFGFFSVMQIHRKPEVHFIKQDKLCEYHFVKMN